MLTVGVITSLYPGGTRPTEGVFARLRWQHFAARGHRVRILRPLPYAPFWMPGREARALGSMARRESDGRVEVARPRYLHLPGWSQSNPERFARAASAEAGRWAREGFRPSVWVADYAWPAAVAGPWVRRSGAAFVVSGRGSDVLAVALDPRLSERLGAELKRADGRLAVSADLAQAMDRLGGGGCTRLVPNGVDQDRFAPRDRRAARVQLRESGRGWIADDNPLVLVVGHWIPRKDPLLALRAFALGAPPRAHIAFLGAGPLERNLAELAAELHLAERCHLVGATSPEELAIWYAACDVLLLTSHREGRPNVVLEALSSGRPVVATEAGGTAELLGDFPAGLVKSRDPARIGAALGAVLQHPPSAERCRAAVAPYTWEGSAELLESVLLEARERARGDGRGA